MRVMLHMDRRRVLTISLTLAACMAIAGCATDLSRRLSKFDPLPSGQRARVIRVDQDARITWESIAFERTVKAGSQWRELGRVSEGTVFRPLDGPFTIEGAHVHEAYLVLSGQTLVGFYLPVEGSFVDAKPPVVLKFTEGK